MRIYNPVTDTSPATMTYRLKKYILQCVAAAMLPAALLSLTGCVTDDSDCPPPDKDGEKNDGATMTMRFTVVTRGDGQHWAQAPGLARNLLPSPNPQLGTIAENYLDLRNLTFLLFDNNGILITPFYPDAKATDTEKYNTYSVTATMPQEYFDYAAGENVTFYIMVTGNESAHRPQRQNYTPGIAFNQIFGMNRVATFGVPLAKEDGNEVSWWQPTVSGQYIPMSGLQRFTVRKSDLEASTSDNPYMLSAAADGSQDINMLRALAKIEVIDRLGYDDAAGVQLPVDERVSVTKVELSGFFSRAAILPEIGNWSLGGTIETQYVSSPSIPSDAHYNAPRAFSEVNPPAGPGVPQNTNAVIDFFFDEQATGNRADRCRVYSAYVPEYAVAHVGGAQPAYIQVTVRNPGDATGNNPAFELKMSEYDAGKPGASINILRNNIYRYEIRNVGQQLGVVWTVCDMDEGVVNIPPFE